MPRSPTDVNQLARSIVAQATGEKRFATIEGGKRRKNPAAVALGRKGGLKGGKVRAARLTAKKRLAIAKKAAKVRWTKARKAAKAGLEKGRKSAKKLAG